jgi:3-hydroxybutyrate dehydrogenase
MQDIPNNVWEETINVNLNSSFHTTKGVLPYMQQKGWGRIINIAGVQGVVGMSNKGALVAAKHALVGLTKSTAL